MRSPATSDVQTAGPALASPERELWLLAHPSQLREARGFADEAASSFGFDEAERYAFTFAVNEAVSNAIEHGSPSPEGTIRLCVAEENGSLALYVQDYGTFAPDAPAVDALPHRGRGLAFMAAMVDEIDLRQDPGSTIVRLSKRRGA
jgi:anti-sigma regulatory factor (Ser/Thr protein kinase)